MTDPLTRAKELLQYRDTNEDLNECINGYSSPMTYADLQWLIDQVERQAEALRHARSFIKNGIDLGFIRMPDKETPDPAHNTLPIIEAALETK